MTKNGFNAGSPVCRVLAVGSSAMPLKSLASVLTEQGIADVRIEGDPRFVLRSFREHRPDVVVIEADAANLNELSVVVQFVAETRVDEFLPFVMFSFSGKPAATNAAISAPFPIFFQDGSNLDELSRLIWQLVSARRIGLRALDRANVEARTAHETEIAMAREMAKFSECRDHPESGHVFRVGKWAGEIALVMGLSARDVELIQHAAPLHDVGQLAISDGILLKDDLLTLEEMDVVKTHTGLGAALLSGTTSEILQMAGLIALFHHENWDGTGYVPGVAGTSIPLPARIVRVADTFDALTNPRPFADQFLADHAVTFMVERAGRLFDPTVIEAFLEVRERSGNSDRLVVIADGAA